MLVNHNQSIGKIGEMAAINFLKAKGYTILEKNYRSRWGEIDIIVKKNNKISFVEVKIRTGEMKDKLYEAVNMSKINHLARPIQYYILQKKIKNYKLSLDVISVLLNHNMSIDKINFFENINN